jgi:hypothetical protein
MTKKKIVGVVGLAFTIAAVIAPALVGAQAVPVASLVVPSSTAPALLTSFSNILTDPGVLAIVILAAAIPLFFYIVHQLMGLLPKSRGRKQ